MKFTFAATLALLAASVSADLTPVKRDHRAMSKNALAKRDNSLIDSIQILHPLDGTEWKKSEDQVVKWNLTDKAPARATLQIINNNNLDKPIKTFFRNVFENQTISSGSFSLKNVKLPPQNRYVFLFVDPENQKTILAQGGEFTVKEGPKDFSIDAKAIKEQFEDLAAQLKKTLSGITKKLTG